MDKKTVIDELGRIKHNCNCMSDEECLNGFCPYHGNKKDDSFSCFWDDIHMGLPCNWEIPEEVL